MVDWFPVARVVANIEWSKIQMPQYHITEEDTNAPVDAQGKVKGDRRDLELARRSLAGLQYGKRRHSTVLTGDTITATVSEKTGKVTNRNRIGRGEIEYQAYLDLDAVAKEDPEGRALKIVHQRLGIDTDPESPTVGQDVTRLSFWWVDKKPMTPEAKNGLNRRVLQAQSDAINERAKALKAADTPENRAAHTVAVAKLNVTKARITSEYRQDEASAKAHEAAEVALAAAEQSLKEIKSSPSRNGSNPEIEALLAELQSPAPEESPAPAPAPAAPKKQAAPAR